MVGVVVRGYRFMCWGVTTGVLVNTQKPGQSAKRAGATRSGAGQRPGSRLSFTTLLFSSTSCFCPLDDSHVPELYPLGESRPHRA